MNTLILCTAIAMNIYSLPAGSTVVGATYLGERVQLQDGSLLRDWVFVGMPGFDKTGAYLGVKSMGWMPFSALTCNE